MENINTLVFGHKNPDTDSICSSIVHSILDEKNGWKTKPVRLGKINKDFAEMRKKEIEEILKKAPYNDAIECY